MSNEDVFADYIKEMVEQEDNCALNSDWVLWMLRLIKASKGAVINPEWLRASHQEGGEMEPIMFCELTIKTTEDG